MADQFDRDHRRLVDRASLRSARLNGACLRGADLRGADLHEFGREQPKLPVGPCCQRVNMKMRCRVIAPSHHR